MSQVGHNSEAERERLYRRFCEDHEQVRELGRRSVDHAIRAGKTLVQIRDTFGEGQPTGWRKWLEEKGVSKSHADRYLLIGRECPNLGHFDTLQEAEAAARDERDRRKAAEAEAERQKAVQAAEAASLRGADEDAARAEKAAEKAQQAGERAQRSIERRAAHREQAAADEPREVNTAITRGPAQGTSEEEWYTPAVFIEAAREAMGGIDLDPASSAEAQATVGARRWYGKDTDGLTRPWDGRLWLNPPYTSGLVDRFASRLVEHLDSGEVTAAVWLSNASFDTKWGQPLCAAASGLCLVSGRVKFVPGSGQRVSSNASPTMVLYFGGNPSRFRKAFSELGNVWVR